MTAFSIIVPAAGKGLRMGSHIPKQYLSLAGEPILERTLRRLLSLNPSSLCLVVNETDTAWKALPSAAHCVIAVGGESRADSVMSGLQALNLEADTPVLIHDAVRPLFALSDVKELIRQVGTNENGGLLATPVIDTLKQSSDEHRVVGTPNRSEFWQAQTPQLFQAGLLRRALSFAKAQGLVITDEASAVEALELQPLLVEGSRHNIKITTLQDIAFAEYWLGTDLGRAACE
ncbi:MAG: 2-C-methyl-D-erythritol 4-phosphate cytidylyltransferase [Candidatus Azotimanducaceae bacterium]|jgi:2-C-methyl-D-erythritol 4-phosphate cytidylyltransferase